MACAVSMLTIGACAAPDAAHETREPVYGPLEIEFLEGNLVRFQASLKNAAAPEDIAEYTKCAAAGYTVARGYGFARHVRSEMRNDQGVWRGDAVYTISPELPAGLKTIDAEILAMECRERGIPLM